MGVTRIMESRHLHVCHCLVSLAQTRNDNLVISYILQLLQPVAVAEAAVSQFLSQLFNSLIATVHFLYCYLFNSGILGIVQGTNISMFR